MPVESDDVVEVCPENDTTEVKLETSSVDTVNDETRGLAKKCLPELPFDALFLNNNDQDISNIIKKHGTCCVWPGGGAQDCQHLQFRGENKRIVKNNTYEPIFQN